MLNYCQAVNIQIFAAAMEIKGDHIILTKQEYEQMLRRIAQLEDTNKKLEVRIKELEAQLNKNSRNSHKPPASDGLKRIIKNNREPSGRKKGGQEGHKGKTLEMVKNPDKIIRRRVKGQCRCGKDLELLEVLRIERRQVFDLPEKLNEVTEHQVEVKQCSCGCLHRAACPVEGSTQYGERIKALIVYLNQYNFLSYERLQEFMQDVFALPLGGDTIETSSEKCAEHLKGTEAQIKKGLLNSRVIHNDETSVRCNGKT